MPSAAAQVSREPPPPLAGEYKMSDPVWFLGKDQTTSNGDKLVHGQQGEVVGPGRRSDGKPGVAVRFPGNKASIHCLLTEVRAASPPPSLPPDTDASALPLCCAGPVSSVPGAHR